MNQSDQIKDGILFLVIYIVAFLASVFIPLVILPALLFFPLPFVIYSYRYKWQPTAIFTILTALLATIVYGDLGLLITALAAATGLFIGAGLQRGRRAYEVWTRATLGGVIGFLLIFAYIQMIFQLNLEQEIIKFTQDTFELSDQMFGAVGMDVMNEQQKELLEAQMVGLIKLIPAFILLVGGAYGFITQWVSHKVLNRIHKTRYAFPPFRALRFPTAIIWVYLLALLVTLFQGTDQSTLLIASENVLVVIGALLIIQGFSFLFYLVHLKNLPKALPIVAIILTVLFPFFFVFIMRLLGVIDIGFDLRKYMEEKK